MSSFSRIVWLILIFMAIGTLSQRAGPRAKSTSNRPRGGHRSNYQGLGSTIGYRDTQNCKTVNGVTTCSSFNKQNRLPLKISVCMLGAGLAYIFYSFKKSTDKAKRRQTIIDSALNQFHTKYLPQSTALSSKQKRKLIKQLMNKKYTLIVNSKEKNEKYFCYVNVTQLDKQNQNGQSKYMVKMVGSDEVGNIQLQGILMFKYAGLRLKLYKVDNGRTQAAQIRQSDIFIYQGEGTPQKIVGTWSSRGHQSSQNHSGNWTMEPHTI